MSPRQIFWNSAHASRLSSSKSRSVISKHAPRLCFFCRQQGHYIAKCEAFNRIRARSSGPKEQRTAPSDVTFRIRFDIDRPGVSDGEREVRISDVAERVNHLRLRDNREIRFIDSHFHYDMLVAKKIYASEWRSQGEQRFKLGGCIANFAYPALYCKDFARNKPMKDTAWAVRNLTLPGLAQQLKNFPKDAVIGAAYGCHPKSADEWNLRVQRALMHILIRRIDIDIRALALGECGLDDTTDIPHEVQLDCFRDQIALAAAFNLPIVLHIRTCKGQNLEEIALHELGKQLDRQHAMHFHCFSYSRAVAERWTSIFPNVKFGLTGMICSRKCRKELVDFATNFPMNAILTESDAPHFDRNKRGTPMKALEVAEQIAYLRRMPVEEVIRQTTRNAEELYRFRLN